MGMDGCIGLSMLADRESGRCIVTTAWRTEEAMHASEEGIRASRERAAQIFGEMPTVAEWEIAIMHRMHETGDGARMRVIWGHTDPGHMDDPLSTFRVPTMPRWSSCPVRQLQHDGRPAQRPHGPVHHLRRPDTMREADTRAAALRRASSARRGWRSTSSPSSISCSRTCGFQRPSEASGPGRTESS